MVSEDDEPMVGTHDRPTSWVSLPDGRWLAYSEFGDAQGYPVLNCHGTLVGRFDIAPADAAARRAGIRLISPDRPGVGQSTRARGRIIAEWAEDVTSLLGELQIERCSALGWSMGAPFAAALGALLPLHVDAVVMVAGVIPLDWAWNAPDVISPLLVPYVHLCYKWPGLACLRFRRRAELAHLAPQRWWRKQSEGMGDADVEAVEQTGTAFLREAVWRGLRHPGGCVDDYLAIDQPWGFSYESISRPIRLWHGTEDTLAPHAWSEEACRRMPGATLRSVAGAGHFVAWTRFDELLDEVRAAVNDNEP